MLPSAHPCSLKKLQPHEDLTQVVGIAVYSNVDRIRVATLEEITLQAVIGFFGLPSQVEPAQVAIRLVAHRNLALGQA